MEAAAHAAALGFHFLWIEMEHPPITLETLRLTVLATGGRRTRPSPPISGFILFGGLATSISVTIKPLSVLLPSTEPQVFQVVVERGMRQQLVNDGLEVGQRANRRQRRTVCGPDQAAQRGQHRPRFVF